MNLIVLIIKNYKINKKLRLLWEDKVVTKIKPILVKIIYKWT